MPFGKKIEKETLILLFFFLLAFSLRLALIEHRPLHHDEGVNGYFMTGLMERGHYAYNPENYHGPSFYFLSVIPFILFGKNVLALRFMPALLGSMLVLLLFPLRKRLGFAGTATTAFFVCFSPALFYYSIYAIHEILFVFFSIASIVSLVEFVETAREKWLYSAAVFLAFLFTTKEASFYFGPLILGIFAFSLFCCKPGIRSAFRKKRNIKMAFIAICLFFAVYTVVFTSFFSNPQGLIDSVKGPFIWLTQPSLHAGHEKPFYYYFELLFFYEFPLLALGLLGAIVAFLKKNPSFSFFGVFVIAVLLAASTVEYKVPWILINFLAPFAFLAGFFVKESIDFLNEKNRFIALAFIVFLLASVFFTLMVFFALNVEIPASEENKLAYVHTTMQAKSVIEKITKMHELDKGFTLAIVSKQSIWPLPWIFEDFNVTYYGLEENNFESILNSGFTVVLFEKNGESSALNPEGFEKEPFSLRPGLDMIAFYKKNTQIE